MPKFKISIAEGKLTFDRRDLFDIYVGTLKGDYLLQVNPIKRERSLDQNALYWVWTHELGQYFGYTDDEMHETLKQLFWCEVKHLENKKTGEVIEVKISKSTTIMSVAEFSEYLARVQQFGAEWGVALTNEL